MNLSRSLMTPALGSTRLKFATSTLADGGMGRTVAFTDDIRVRRRAFIEANFGQEAFDPVMVESAHGNNIHVATKDDVGRAIKACDGLITTTPNLPLMVTHQDCVPIVISDDQSSFVCVLHAGWRGVVAGILPAAIEEIDRLLKDGGVYNPAFSESLGIYFGPAIGPCHFEVQEDVAEQFRAISADSVIERDGKLFVDLHAALAAQALEKGIGETQIIMSQDCTFHAPSSFCLPAGMAPITGGESFRYTSWRRDHDAEANMITVAMLTP